MNKKINWWNTILDEKESKAAAKSIAGRFLSEGKITKEFELRIKRDLGVKYAFMMPSGTMSLVVSLIAAGIKPGDEVIVPGMSFIASATCVSLTGATPIFADIEDDYWCVCPDDLESKITPKTKAIIAVHNTVLGPALGGCRMYPYKSEEDALVDVLRLSRGMTYKAYI